MSEAKKKDYGLLESAVTFSADKVYGDYGESIPDDFNSEKFLALMKGRIPEDYYETFKGHDLEVVSMRKYYLLKVYDKGILILFELQLALQGLMDQC